jgi:hypothetical protein
MAARVMCGWKCGKECGALGLGWWDISCWRSADSGSEGTSQTAMPARFPVANATLIIIYPNDRAIKVRGCRVSIARRTHCSIISRESVKVVTGSAKVDFHYRHSMKSRLRDQGHTSY